MADNTQDLVTTILKLQAQVHQAIGSLAAQVREADVENPDVVGRSNTTKAFIVSSRALAHGWDVFTQDFDAQKTALAEMIARLDTAPASTESALKSILTTGKDTRGRHYHALLVEALRPILAEVVTLAQAVRQTRDGEETPGFAP